MLTHIVCGREEEQMKEWTIHAVVSEMPVWGQYPLKSTQMMGQWRKNENCLQWYYWKCWDFEQASLSCANAVNNCMTSWNCLGVCVFVVWLLLWVVVFWEGGAFSFAFCLAEADSFTCTLQTCPVCHAVRVCLLECTCLDFFHFFHFFIFASFAS